MPETALTLLEQIRTAPDVETWVWIIRLTLAGGLDGYIENHFGTVEDLMLTTIENSQDKPKAEACFEQALEKVIDSWNPSADPNENSMESALRLLQTFRPQSGLDRLLDYLLEGHTFTVFQFDSERADLSYLDLLAWNTLRAYFPLEKGGPSHQPNYEGYLRFLEGSLTRPVTRALACRRLLEMGVMKPESEQLRELVVSNGSSLVTALVEWLDGSDRLDRNIFLKELYLHSTDSSAAQTSFQITLDRLGGRVSRVGSRVLLTLSEGDVVSIPCTEEANKEKFSGWQRESVWLEEWMVTGKETAK